MAEMIGFAELYGLTELKKMYLHDFFMILATSRGRGGFEREMLTTVTNKMLKGNEQPNKNKKRWV